LRPSGGSRSMKRISLSPKIRMRPAWRNSWKPARARPVFWIYGLVIGRSMPRGPARLSSGRPIVSGRIARRPPTVKAGTDAMASEEHLALVRRGYLQFFAILGNGPPREDEAFALQDAHDLRVAERLLGI